MFDDESEAHLGDEGPLYPEGPFYRCAHCRGFYETSRDTCKWCDYKAVVCDAGGKPRQFPDRDTCRAIQIAEYEQLPQEAHDDCFRPDPDELSELCGCLHCGRGGHVFEAVEMRWHLHEKMWCCPCTTCGGRGYGFDIHSLTPKWECNACRHKWAPPDGNRKPSNCKCPKCGGTEASGWFDDEYSYEEIEAMSEEEYKKAFGQTRAEEQAEWEAMDRDIKARQERGEQPTWGTDAVPLDDDEDEGEAETPQDIFKPAEFDPSDPDNAPYQPGAEREDAAAAERGGEPKMPDDIDFPRRRRRREEGGGEDDPEIKDGDIPF